MAERDIAHLGSGSKMRNRILNEATKLFAIKGYSAVSVRDIAKAVGIKQSSLYNHYASKEALLEAILSNFEMSYKAYFDWLERNCENADTLEQVMDFMFQELLSVHGGLGNYYGISLLMQEQFKFESVRRRVFKIIYEDSIQSMQSIFDRLIEKGIISSSDSKTIATFFMSCVPVGSDLRIYEGMGVDSPIDCTEMYVGLKQFLTTALRNGFIPKQ